MKNLIILILFVLVCALGSFLYYSQKNPGKDPIAEVTSFFNKTKETIVSNVEKTEKKFEHAIGSKTHDLPESFKSLPADTVIAVDLPMKALDPAIQHITAVRAKIFGSAIAKKMNLEQMIEDGMGQGMPSSDLAQKPVTFTEMLDILSKVESLNLLVRSKVVDSRAAPMLNLTLKFRDDQLNKLIKTSLDPEVAAINEQAPGTIRISPEDPNTYSLELKQPIAPIDLLGSVSNKNNQFVLKLAALGSKVDQVSNTEFDFKPLIQTVGLGENALVSFFHGANFLQMGENLSKSEAAKNPEIKEGINALKGALGEYKGAATSAHFNKGFKSRSCTLVEANSAALSTYQQTIDRRSQSNDNFLKLVSSKTAAAIGFKTGAIASSLQTMLAAQEKDPKNEATAKKTKSAIEKLKTLKLNDIGMIANAPTTSFEPDYAIYIEHDSGLSLKDMVNQLNSLIADVATDSFKPGTIQVQTNTAGIEEVKFTAFEAYPITFRAISENVIIGTNQDSLFGSLTAALQGSEAYLSEKTLAAKNIDINLKSTDYQVFFSPASLTSFARQFLPFLTMAAPELTITDAEINEVFDLLNFNILLTSSSEIPSENMLCASGQAVIF
jgi:gas vesicle protein